MFCTENLKFFQFQEFCKFFVIFLSHFQTLIFSSSFCQIPWLTMALLSYSIASGIPVALTIVKCWNINHQNHRHTYSHEPHDQNDKSNRSYTLYDCDDWYFITWHPLLPLEFHWQLSNWVGIIIHMLTWICLQKDCLKNKV